MQNKVLDLRDDEDNLIYCDECYFSYNTLMKKAYSA
jgi:hypothetical protein